MISLASSDALVRAVQGRAGLRSLAARFVAGPDVTSMTVAAQQLRGDGIGASAFHLGEYVRDLTLVNESVQQLRQATTALAAVGLDVHLSIDPTQAGLMTSTALCDTNVRHVATAVADVGQPRDHGVLVIGMEDSTTTDATLDLYDTLRQDGLPVAVTLQAYLNRTMQDVHRLAHAGAWVRLVKGALAEPATVAATDRSEIDSRYRTCLARLFSPEACRAGCRPSVATHDLRLVVQALRLAREHGWSPEEFEFEMLHGVRADLQRELARRGYRVRAYLPFGADWFPYTIRRIGENPRNTRFVATAVVSSVLHR
jgi:proline dehydrogenase